MTENGRHMDDLIGSQHIPKTQQQVMVISQAIGHGESTRFHYRARLSHEQLTDVIGRTQQFTGFASSRATATRAMHGVLRRSGRVTSVKLQDQPWQRRGHLWSVP